MKFRKKPIVVDAVKYMREQNINEVQCFVGDYLIYNPYDNEYYIATLEGNMKISKGDWIIKGINGEFYPCKLDVFSKTYVGV